MTIEDAKKHVQSLSAKAAAAVKSEDAMRFSQSANNVANAMYSLKEAERVRE